MEKTYYSNGKLLITGEYTVLDGAQAFALPTIFGQYLHISKGSDKILKWQSYTVESNCWLNVDIDFNTIIYNDQLYSTEVNTLIGILHSAYKKNPAVLDNAEGYKIQTELTFPREWGLGSSSTLINNIAQWFGIDAYALLWESFGGSGYDIACAQNDFPILYTIENGKPTTKKVTFNPDFTDKIYFVYLNKKQNSRSAIEAYRNKQKEISAVIEAINQCTQKALNAENVTEFTSALEKHENIMASILEITPVKKQLFPDFKGTIKSLGAWGGDFVLAISETNPLPYFSEKGFKTILPYKEMIK
ncbi:GYDIA family GHMP kinase [Flavobacterium sp. MK4S-17]|uniref:GYDIA family GHMP kinase n=1 Tax=Flavobacterium sp. MK4S-17 TaxID=2543737 RepID=UPI00135906B1|nr:GYDIA family GHMP kinase [Flavobacterium sp. MK4S-17]